MDYTVKTPVTISSKDLGYILAGAQESGLCTWMGRMKPLATVGVVARTEGVHWTEDEPFLEDEQFAFTVEFDDPDEDEEGDLTGMKTITRDDIVKGLQAMADKYPDHFADVVSDNCDADTYDVAMQCIVFGEIVYG